MTEIAPTYGASRDDEASPAATQVDLRGDGCVTLTLSLTIPRGLYLALSEQAERKRTPLAALLVQRIVDYREPEGDAHLQMRLPL